MRPTTGGIIPRHAGSVGVPPRSHQSATSHITGTGIYPTELTCRMGPTLSSAACTPPRTAYHKCNMVGIPR